MTKLTTCGIYVLFTLGILLIVYAGLFIFSQINNCPPYIGEYDSILSKWFNFPYFEMKIQFGECMDGVKKFCNIKGFSSCGTPNFKPGITYLLLGFSLITTGTYLRKKFLNIN